SDELVLTQAHRAGVGPIQPAQHVEHSSFARPVGANEAGYLTGQGREVDTGHGTYTAEGEMQIGNLERLALGLWRQEGQDVRASRRRAAMVRAAYTPLQSPDDTFRGQPEYH